MMTIKKVGINSIFLGVGLMILLSDYPVMAEPMTNNLRDAFEKLELKNDYYKFNISREVLGDTLFNHATMASATRAVDVMIKYPVKYINIPDPNLESAIRDELNIPTGGITQEDMERLTYLGAENKGITDLTGLEYAINLRRLHLSNNQISDISPLENLTSLWELIIGSNDIEDISVLKDLTSLTSLNLQDNSIEDIKVLSNLTNLTNLVLMRNQISDITPLSGLVNLKLLNLEGNVFSSVEPIIRLPELKELVVAYNTNINDIELVRELTQLKRLWIHDCGVENIDFLSGLSELENLSVHSNHIADFSPLKELSNITTTFYNNQNVSFELDAGTESIPNPFINIDGSYMTVSNLPSGVRMSDDNSEIIFDDLAGGQVYKLKAVADGITINATITVKDMVVNIPDPNLEAAIRETLGIWNTGITERDMLHLIDLTAKNRGIYDLTGLEYATNLRELNLSGNRISDISALSSLTDITYLDLGDNQISDVSALRPLVKLYNLSLRNNQIRDASPLSGMVDLMYLNLRFNQISDISALSGLEKLIELNLDANEISNISVLGNMNSLTELYFHRNQVEDISVLSNLTRLNKIGMSNNQVSDISILGSMNTITFLDLSGNRIEDISPLRQLVNLDNLNLSRNRISDFSTLEQLPDITHLNLGTQTVEHRVTLKNGTMLNPFIDEKGLKIPLTQAPSGIRTDGTNAKIVFDNPRNGQSYQVTASTSTVTIEATIIVNVNQMISGPHLTVTPDPLQNMIQLDWTSVEESAYQVYRKYFEENNFKLIDGIDLDKTLNSLEDYSGKDLAAPSAPSLNNASFDNFGRLVLTLNSSVDNGSVYEYYVRAISKDGLLSLDSNVVSATITTGIKGYSYVIDDNSDTIPDSEIEVASLTQMTFEKKVDGKYFHVVAIDNAGNVSKAFHFKIELPMELTATPIPTEDMIHLEWTEKENSAYQVHQKRPGSDAFETISTTDFVTKTQVNVLNVYPYVSGKTINFTTWDGESVSLPQSAILKQWMEEPNAEHPKGYGQGMIEVTPVDIDSFNLSPEWYLKDSQGNYQYDVIVFGIADSWGNDDGLSELAEKAVDEYVSKGYGLLLGHDTAYRTRAVIPNLAYGFSRLAEKYLDMNILNLSSSDLVLDNFFNGNDPSASTSYGGHSIVQTHRKGLLTNYPWEIGEIGTNLTIPYTHNAFQKTGRGEIWMRFNWQDTGLDNPFNSYLYTYNNAAMIQTGHSIASGSNAATIATPDEQKVMANTLFYLKQLSSQNYLDDYSGQDLEAPTIPSMNSIESDIFNRITVTLNPSVDNGSTYEYYVEAIPQNGGATITSNTVSATITTGVKGYSYVVDDNPNTIPDNIVEVEGTEEIVLDSSANGKYLHIRAVDNGRGSGNASETLHIKLEVEEKRLELTAEANDEEDMIRLDWTEINDALYKVYQKKPGDTEFQTIGTMDLKTNEPVKVLNIYPRSGTLVTYKTWDGEWFDTDHSGLLKMWMEVPNDEHPKGYGQGLIDVTPVKFPDFNANPEKYLYKTESGEWNYDVIFVGAWDCNGNCTFNQQLFSLETTDYVSEFIEEGYGFLIGHDFQSFRENLVISNENDANQSVSSTEVRLEKKGILTSYPWYLGEVGSLLTVPFTHNNGNFTNADIWIKFNNITTPGYCKNWCNPEMYEGDATNNHYLVTKNNLGMIQTGHSNGRATSDEQKILANTLFYLKQITSQNYLNDYSGQDVDAPDKPTLAELKTDEYGRVTLTFAPMQDNGSTYEYYVEAKNVRDDSAVQSNVASVTVTTGIKGVSYVVDNNPTTIPDSVIEVEELRGVIFNESDIGKYLHVKVIDNSRGGGNQSETLHIKIEPLELSAQANASGNFIRLDWGKIENATYKAYQKKPGDDEFQSIELVADNHLDDYSGQDIAAPTNPSIKSIYYTMDNKINVVINPSRDNGSTYKYYVEAARKDGSFKTTSNKVTETITTGIAGYSYVVDSNPNTIPDDAVDTTSTTIQAPTNNQGRYYIHIKAVDNAGNASETIHYELTDTEEPALVVTQDKTAWTNQDVILTAVAEETGSGLKHIILPDDEIVTEKATIYTVSQNGTYRFQAEDYMGNVTTVDKAVRNIDKVAPTGGIVIADGQEKLSSEETWIEFSYADDLSGVALIEVYDLDVNGNPVGDAFRSEKPTQGNWQLEWILSHPYQKDGYQKARVGIRITDNAGNVSTYKSQEVIIESFKITGFRLTNVVNPKIYNATNPFVPLEFPNIPSQELLAGGSFSFDVEYEYGEGLSSGHLIDAQVSIYLIEPNGNITTDTITLTNQPLTGAFKGMYEIPFNITIGTEVYLDVRLGLKTEDGNPRGVDVFPKPSGTKLLIGTIEDDIRGAIRFNEIR